VRVLVVIYVVIVSFEYALLGKAKSLLCQVMVKLPHPLAEHVSTPLNGAAALTSVGWVIMRGVRAE